MDYKKSLDIITKILKNKNTFSVEDKEALMTAIGVLDSVAIGKQCFDNKIKKIKNKKERGMKWDNEL